MAKFTKLQLVRAMEDAGNDFKVRVFDKKGEVICGVFNKNPEVFKVMAITRENVSDMTDQFEADLRAAGKYGAYYFSYVSTPDEKFSMKYLPIYGNADHYVTKWFMHSKEDAIADRVNELKKGMGIVEFELIEA